jgi:hypothetical protein
LARGRRLVKKTPVNDYAEVHPALDFFNGKAIISVGGKWLNEYDNGALEFVTKPLCVVSDGAKFEYSKQELGNQRLFHSGYLDIPQCRWDFKDIDNFSQNPTAPTIAQVYSVIRKQFEHYLDFYDKRLYDLFPCFIIYTYYYPLFNGAPIIQLWGEFRTGKTKICSLIEALAFNPINSANISSSSVFRLVESRRATVLLDESEDLSSAERAKEIRNMLLAGTGKSGETFRQEKLLDDSFRTQSFKVFSPKLIANIAGIDVPALQSRTIRITTIGTSDAVRSNREVEQEDERWQKVRNSLYRICLCRYTEIIESRYHLPQHVLNGRNLAIWQGILSVANCCGGKVWKNVLAYAYENKDYIDADAEESVERPRKVLRTLQEHVMRTTPEDSDPTEIILLTPDDLVRIITEGRIEFSSKRDLGLLMGRIGFHSRVICKDGIYSRFYELSKEKINILCEKR